MITIGDICHSPTVSSRMIDDREVSNCSGSHRTPAGRVVTIFALQVVFSLLLSGCAVSVKAVSDDDVYRLQIKEDVGRSKPPRMRCTPFATLEAMSRAASRLPTRSWKQLVLRCMTSSP